MHKKFDEIKPYSYFLVRKSDGMKYVGIRYGNVKLNLTPNEDFGKVYFTSGILRKEFRNNPENFEFKIKYTFDSIEEMFEWERRITLRIYKYDTWANQGWGTNFGENPNIGKLISEGKRKTKRSGKTSIEQGAEALKQWIWETDEGGEYREVLSTRKKKYWENLSPEDRIEILRKRSLSMDFQAAAKKAHVTNSVVGEDGLTNYQRNAIAAHKTKLENGTYEVSAKKYSEWINNTEEGIAFKKVMGEKTRERILNYSPEERAEILRKQLETRNNKSEEEKLEISKKYKESINKVGEDGLTVAQRRSIKVEETKKLNGTDKVISKKRGELFNKKLGEMSEEEFEKYCANYIPRLAKSFRTRRKKYLETHLV